MCDINSVALLLLLLLLLLRLLVMADWVGWLCLVPGAAGRHHASSLT
jgi:hypothetical protein